MLTTYNVIWKKKEEELDNEKRKIRVSGEIDEIEFTNADFDEMVQDIEDIIDEQSIMETEKLYKEAMPPNVKFNKKNKLSITDLSAQLWCEQQMEFTLTTGRKRETEAMRLGIARHEVLEKADHKIIDVEVYTREESLGYRLLNSLILIQQLLECKKAREVWVFGLFKNYVLRGIIDELRIEYDRVMKTEFLIISDTKTRKVKKEPSLAQKRTSAIQVQAYCYILQQLRRGKADFSQLFKIYECDPKFEFTAPDLKKFKNLETLGNVLNGLFVKLPVVKEEMEIVYEHEGVVFSTDMIPFNLETTVYTINSLLSYWEGKRICHVVSKDDKWKCNFCDFKNNCVRGPLNT